MTTWNDFLVAHRQRFEAELLDFLRIPSISSLPANAPDVRRAGEWVVARMRAAGIENVRILETGGHPVVYGDWLHAPGQPTVMIYGHFDTQPVDPLDLWIRPPFEPTVLDGRVYARGASDDKGNMLPPILAVEALLQSEGRLPVNVKFFFEGQEEIGSPQLAPFVAAHKELLTCDMVLSADGGQWDDHQPALGVGFRGICALQIDVTGPDHDLHSGVYGGAVHNPIHGLVQILSSMRSEDGKVLVKGFYDAVRALSAEERDQIARVPFDETRFKSEIGVDALFGEPGYSALERTWARPTLELNGIWGGFQAEGTKTVLPSQAHAKITCRLVADQDPDQIEAAIADHVKRVTPAGIQATVTRFGGSNPYLMPEDHPGNAAARAALMELYGVEPFYARSGGSIPVCSMFLEHLGVYTISYGFGLRDENIHSPNEFFRLSNFVRGQEGYCIVLHKLAQAA